jgi:hypothetical protein
MSNRDRIARAAEEAEVTAREKQAAKAAKPASGTRSRRNTQPVRMKVVWEVASGSGATVATFAYPDKAAAEARAAELVASTKRIHTVRAAKVPME